MKKHIKFISSAFLLFIVLTSSLTYAEENLDNTLLKVVNSEEINISKITELIEKGANVNTHNSEGKSPLVFAICNNNLEAVKTLVKLGANTNSKDFLDGKTPLMYAASYAQNPTILK